MDEEKRGAMSDDDECYGDYDDHDHDGWVI